MVDLFELAGREVDLDGTNADFREPLDRRAEIFGRASRPEARREFQAVADSLREQLSSLVNDVADGELPLSHTVEDGRAVCDQPVTRASGKFTPVREEDDLIGREAYRREGWRFGTNLQLLRCRLSPRRDPGWR